MSLTKQQEAFCLAYVNNGLNATQAYLKAYKSCKKDTTAKVNGSRLLTNANVKAYIESLQNELRKNAVMDIKERQLLLSRMAYGVEKEEVATAIDENGEVKTIFVPLKAKDRRDAIDMLNKMDGAYVQKIEHSGNVDIKKQYELMSDEELEELAKRYEQVNNT